MKLHNLNLTLVRNNKFLVIKCTPDYIMKLCCRTSNGTVPVITFDYNGLKYLPKWHIADKHWKKYATKPSENTHLYCFDKTNIIKLLFN